MDKALRYLALGRKAGTVLTGEDRCCEAVTEGRLKLLLLPADASERTVRRAEGVLEGHRALLCHVPWQREALADALGSGGCAMVGFTDLGLAAVFADVMKERNSEWEETASLLRSRRDKAARRKAAPRKHKNGERGGQLNGS